MTMQDGGSRDDGARPARRQFLGRGAALVSGVLAGGLAGERAGAAGANGPPDIPDWMKVPGADVGSEVYGTPSRFEKGVVRNVPKNLKQYTSTSSRTPLQDLD